MKNRGLLAIIIFFLCHAGFPQTIELSGGYLLNHMYDCEEEYPHWNSEYTNGKGYGIVIAVEDVRVKWAKMRFSLAYEHYDGELYVRSSGLGGGGSKSAEVRKSLLSACIFPHGFTIKKKLDLQIGLQLSWLLHEEFSGKAVSWSIIPYTGGSSTLEDLYDHYNSAFYIGLVGRVAYNIKIAESIYIFPQYSFYFGLSPEFRESPSETRSMRHFFGIGIEKRLGSLSGQ